MCFESLPFSRRRCRRSWDVPEKHHIGLYRCARGHGKWNMCCAVLCSNSRSVKEFCGFECSDLSKATRSLSGFSSRVLMHSLDICTDKETKSASCHYSTGASRPIFGGRKEPWVGVVLDQHIFENER